MKHDPTVLRSLRYCRFDMTSMPLATLLYGVLLLTLTYTKNYAAGQKHTGLLSR